MKKFLAALVLAPTLMSGAVSAHEGGHPPLDDVGRESLRFCESTNDYTKVHLDVDGQHVYGAYQFKRATWRAAVDQMLSEAHAGVDWSTYRDILPSDAPHWVQDHVAAFWWPRAGAHQWFNCHTQVINAMAETPNKQVAPLRDLTEAPIPTFTG